MEAPGVGEDFNGAHLDFSWSAAGVTLGPQGVASGGSAPSACFGEETMIETENGSEKISSLDSGVNVKVCDGKGVDHLVKADILQRTSIVPTKNRFRIKAGSLATDFPTQDLVVSKDHLILVPTDIRDSLLRPVDERLRSDCYDHDGARCDTCAPFPAPEGFAPILVRDMKPHYMVPDPYPGTNWWHVALPQAEYPDGGALVLSCGILAETHRTPTSILVEKQGWLLK